MLAPPALCALPAVACLRHLVRQLPLRPGVQPHLLQQPRQQVQGLLYHSQDQHVQSEQRRSAAKQSGSVDNGSWGPQAHDEQGYHLDEQHMEFWQWEYSCRGRHHLSDS